MNERKPVQQVRFQTERFHIPGEGAHPPGFHLWHVVSGEDDVHLRDDCPKIEPGKTALIRNVAGHLRVLPWGTVVEVVRDDENRE